MQTYPVDIDPKQIVQWLLAEHETVRGGLRIQARRSIETRDIPVRRELHLGDEEREDLSEVITIATLEVAPVHAGDGWLLRVVVEDEVGPRGPDRAAGVEDDEQIDLGMFYSQFIRPQRGTATVVAEVENSAAEAHLSHLLSAIERDQHAPMHGEARD
jgi:hypothetical protein